MVAGMAVIQRGPPFNNRYFQHTDWLGSSRLGVTDAGAVEYDRAYAPFGEVYAELSHNDLNRNFTGQTQDLLSGVDSAPYDFAFREQGPDQGRWETPDPAGLAAVDITNPQTWNRYPYVGNQPLSNVDPLGLFGCGPASCPTESPPQSPPDFGGSPGLGNNIGDFPRWRSGPGVVSQHPGKSQQSQYNEEQDHFCTSDDPLCELLPFSFVSNVLDKMDFTDSGGGGGTGSFAQWANSPYGKAYIDWVNRNPGLIDPNDYQTFGQNPPMDPNPSPKNWIPPAWVGDLIDSLENHPQDITPCISPEGSCGDDMGPNGPGINDVPISPPYSPP